MESIEKEHFETIKKIASTKKYPKLYLPKGCFFGVFLLIAFPLIWIVFGFTNMLWSIIAYIIYKYIVKQKQKAFYKTTILRNEFKNTVLPKISKKVYPQATYTYKHKAESLHIKESNLFQTGIFDNEDWVEAEDYFEGKIDAVDFQFFEMKHYVRGLTVKRGILSLLLLVVDLFILSKTDELTGLSTIDTTKTKKNFRGFFLYADFHKSFEGEVLIKSKTPLNHLKNVFSKSELPLVLLDNEMINKKYEIRATSQQLAYYVLNPKILVAIVAISNTIGDELKMTLKNGKLYLTIPVEKNYFENISIADKTIKTATYDEVVKELELIKELITALHINNRIWMKK